MRVSLRKRGNLTSQSGIGKITSAVVGLTVLLLIASALIPEAQSAGDDLNATGVPLGSLFTSGGVIFTIVMAGLLLGVLAVFLARTKSR